jgi:uncharacterized repeat protein (TIGR03803 family)
MDSAGNLYGTTFAGGAVFGGVVFRLAPSHGSWKENVLYSFQGGRDGANPYAALVFDHAGNLFGTTVYGGRADVGTVFKLAPASGGMWKETMLHAFTLVHRDGFFPFAAVIVNAAGDLYGTTAFGGVRQPGQKGAGTLFKLAAGSGGRWKEEIIFDFSFRQLANQAPQRSPLGGLVSDANGNLFGTAQAQIGSSLGGVVFEVIP